MLRRPGRSRGSGPRRRHRLFYSAAFGSPGDTKAVLGILDVNGWHNVVHILSGVAGLAIGYTVVAIWGFALGDGHAILGFLPVNTEDNVLHALIAVAGYGAYAASGATRPEGLAGPASSPGRP